MAINTLVEVRQAAHEDVQGIKALVDSLAFSPDRAGRLIRIDEGAIFNIISYGGFYIARSELGIVGCGSVVYYPNGHGLAELRSLAVHADYRGSGIGQEIATRVIGHAKKSEYQTMFALTKPDTIPFFESLGFMRGTVPDEKLEKDCVECPLYKKACEEETVVLRLK